MAKHMKYNTGAQAVLQLESQAATYGAIRSTDSDGRRHFIVTCGQCGRAQNTFNSTFDHVDEILNHFRKQGWIFDYKVSPYCTTQCQRTAKKVKQIEAREQRQAEEMNHKVAPVQPAPAPAPAPASVAIGENPLIVVAVVTLLNDHFDKANHRYEEGWSDARIAKEAKTSEEFVARIRRTGGYGELAEHPALTQMRCDIRALEELEALRAQEILGKIAELNARMDKLAGVHHKAQG